MNVNALGSLLPSLGSSEIPGIFSSAPQGLGGASLGGSLSPAGLAGELSSGLSEDAGNMNMLSRLASTLGNLASSCTASASAEGLSAAGSGAGVSVPTPTSSSQQFRSYGSLQQPQQGGGSSSDATLASLIDGASSDDGGIA